MPLEIRTIATGYLDEVREIIPGRFEDDRGFFSETYNRDELVNHGITTPFVQDNQSLSRHKGTVRGLHFQTPPFAQVKLVRVLRGSVFDVAVDIRQGSPTFGQHVSCILSSIRGNQLFIPIGFAHGFCTLEPDTDVLYKVSAPYKKDHDYGLLWSDPALNIAWPVTRDEAILSHKDLQQPLLSALPAHFIIIKDSLQ